MGFFKNDEDSNTKNADLATIASNPASIPPGILPGFDGQGQDSQFAQYDADPTEAFGKHFEKLGHGIGAPEELLKTGSDLIELIVRARIHPDKVGAMTTLLLKADCDQMIEETGSISRATYRRMAGAYALALSIGEGGGARKEFVQAVVAERNRSIYGDMGEHRRRGFFNRPGGGGM